MCRHGRHLVHIQFVYCFDLQGMCKMHKQRQKLSSKLNVFRIDKCQLKFKFKSRWLTIGIGNGDYHLLQLFIKIEKVIVITSHISIDRPFLMQIHAKLSTYLWMYNVQIHVDRRLCQSNNQSKPLKSWWRSQVIQFIILIEEQLFWVARQEEHKIVIFLLCLFEKIVESFKFCKIVSGRLKAQGYKWKFVQVEKPNYYSNWLLHSNIWQREEHSKNNNEKVFFLLFCESYRFAYIFFWQ